MEIQKWKLSLLLLLVVGSIKVKWDNFEGQHSKLSEKVVTNHTQMAKLSAKSL